ncbi:serine/Arginine-related protein 53-like isoform X1 [Chelonus insularis]|uniref:serine/Arginine-related protein 53-like isoform X1 n=1 Tax=Chelonus insularis TaxID=460826 RepID=UPI00158C279B|nr:serine/Arginine-related protein 53-like isoform X1 [Chelonus insularis]XP_034950507.1 serine/Arginine-related protein 53-like isoform X1 [Chelonus insularis]
MESRRYERGGRSNCDSPPIPPSPPPYSPHSRTCESSQKSKSRRSPSYTDYRGCRSSHRDSSQERRRKRRKRSRSSERSRKYSRRRRSRSDSRGRSRSRNRRRSYTPHRSTSRSISRSRTHSYSRSRSRSHSRSKSRSGRNRSREKRRDRGRHYRTPSHDSDTAEGLDRQSVPNIPPTPVQSNAFKNDGSFMEMFKKMQEQMQPKEKPATSVLEEKPVVPPPLMVGKRRGGRILKTGMVAKPKTGQVVEQPKDAWSLYMAEVKKYREVCCQEEDNTRPLVK